MISKLKRFYTGDSMKSKICDTCNWFKEDLRRLNEILKGQFYLANDGKKLCREEESYFHAVKAMEPQLNYHGNFEELHKWYKKMKNLF